MEDISTINEYRMSSVPCARTSYICEKIPSHWWYLEVAQVWELLQAGGSIKVMRFPCDWKEPLMKISYVGTREQGTNKHNKGQTSTQLLHTTALKELLFICPGKSQSTLKRNKRSKLVNCRSKKARNHTYEMHSAIHHISAWKHIGGADKSDSKNKCLYLNWVASKCPFQCTPASWRQCGFWKSPSLSSFVVNSWETNLCRITRALENMLPSYHHKDKLAKHCLVLFGSFHI